MTQDEFFAARHAEWTELDGLLQDVQRRKVARQEPHKLARMAALYRALAGDVARAESSRFAGDLLAYLERLAARAHSTLYAAPPVRLRAVWDFLARGFPRALRRDARYFAASAALFALPMVLGILLGALAPHAAERIVPSSQLAQAAHSYSEGFANGRPDGQGAMMTGFYVEHNVGIAFRCFATGIFFGVGSAFFLVFNGLMIGIVLGYVIGRGYGGNILAFVATHSAFELTAIVIAGAAGLRMGYALVRTGGESRLGSLRRQGPEILQLVLGAGAMLLVAAMIEGLWSGSSFPALVKYATGVGTATLVTGYLALAGREGPAVVEVRK